MSIKDAIKIHVRCMTRSDIADVLEIENESFEFAWSEEDFIGCLLDQNCIGMVAEHNNLVVGYMVYELDKAKLLILNLAVSKQFQRRGIGSQMVAKLIGRRNRVVLETRETNLPAQLFFRENGFRAAQQCKGFYDDSPEDAYLMEYHRHKNDSARNGSLNTF